MKGFLNKVVVKVTEFWHRKAEPILFVLLFFGIPCAGGWAVTYFPHLLWPNVWQGVWVVLGVTSGFVILLLEFLYILWRSGPEYDDPDYDIRA